MALILCPDCEREISEHALKCLDCGAPIASAEDLGPVRTIQETGKMLKLHTVGSTLMLIGGVIWLALQMYQFSQLGYQVQQYNFLESYPVAVIACGFLWVLYTRFAVWWHHR